MQEFANWVCVVGTNDLSPATENGEHVTMPIVRRSYIEDPGAVLGERGTVFNEDYHHNFVETELWQLARYRKVTRWSKEIVIEHLHPDWGKREEDATDAEGDALALRRGRGAVLRAGGGVDVDVIVPFRGGCPHRERAWAWVRRRYPQSGLRAIDSGGGSRALGQGVGGHARASVLDLRGGGDRRRRRLDRRNRARHPGAGLRNGRVGGPASARSKAL